MNIKAMNQFLSEENIKRHIEHLRDNKLRLSIIEKSLPEIKGKTLDEIIKSNIKRDIKNEATSLLWYIKAHESFFCSYSITPGRSKLVDKCYSSGDRFLYDIYEEAMKREYGFLYIYINERNIPIFKFADKYDGAFVKYQPRLVIDLYEHTYYSDYGFKKDKFLRGALSHLDLAKLS